MPTNVQSDDISSLKEYITIMLRNLVAIVSEGSQNERNLFEKIVLDNDFFESLAKGVLTEERAKENSARTVLQTLNLV